MPRDERYPTPLLNMSPSGLAGFFVVIGMSLGLVRLVGGFIFLSVADLPGKIPRILKVVRASGHKTLRVIFPKDTTEPEQVAVINELRPYGASYERAYSHFLAIDVVPGGDYQRICDILWALEQDGALTYDTGAT